MIIANLTYMKKLTLIYNMICPMYCYDMSICLCADTYLTIKVESIFNLAQIKRVITKQSAHCVAFVCSIVIYI